MRYCDCENLKPGMVLAKPIYSNTNELLLAAGYVLDAKLIERLQCMIISPVCIEEPGTESVVIEEMVDAEVLNCAQNTLKETFTNIIEKTRRSAGENLDHIINNVQKSGQLSQLDQIKKAVTALIDELLDNLTTDWSTLPSRFFSGNHFQHGVDTTILSVLLGIHFSFRYQELKHLGMGAMLHDLGMSLLPDLIEKKNCEFSAADLAQYRKHPEYGVNLMTGAEESLYIEKQCVLQHHEQPDGEGFPQRLMGTGSPPLGNVKNTADTIFRLAEIIHTADAYLNLTTGGWTQEPLTPEQALLLLVKCCPSKHNPHIVAALSHVVILFPKGAHVRIMKNHSHRYIGYRGVVAEPNREEPHKPKLVLIANRFGEKIKPELVDFKDEKFMEIKLEL